MSENFETKTKVVKETKNNKNTKILKKIWLALFKELLRTSSPSWNVRHNLK